MILNGLTLNALEAFGWLMNSVSVVDMIIDEPFCWKPEELAESNSNVIDVMLNDGLNSFSNVSIEAR